MSGHIPHGRQGRCPRTHPVRGARGIALVEVAGAMGLFLLIASLISAATATAMVARNRVETAVRFDEALADTVDQATALPTAELTSQAFRYPTDCANPFACIQPTATGGLPAPITWTITYLGPPSSVGITGVRVEGRATRPDGSSVARERVIATPTPVDVSRGGAEPLSSVRVIVTDDPAAPGALAAPPPLALLTGPTFSEVVATAVPDSAGAALLIAPEDTCEFGSVCRIGLKQGAGYAASSTFQLDASSASSDITFSYLGARETRLVQVAKLSPPAPTSPGSLTMTAVGSMSVAQGGALSGQFTLRNAQGAVLANQPVFVRLVPHAPNPPADTRGAPATLVTSLGGATPFTLPVPDIVAAGDWRLEATAGSASAALDVTVTIAPGSLQAFAAGSVPQAGEGQVTFQVTDRGNRPVAGHDLCDGASCQNGTNVTRVAPSALVTDATGLVTGTFSTGFATTAASWPVPGASEPVPITVRGTPWRFTPPAAVNVAPGSRVTVGPITVEGGGSLPLPGVPVEVVSVVGSAEGGLRVTSRTATNAVGEFSLVVEALPDAAGTATVTVVAGSPDRQVTREIAVAIG